MSLNAINAAVSKHALQVMGGFAVAKTDALATGQGTMILIGPDEPAFWSVFPDSAEARDGRANPLDRWSQRVLTDVATSLGGVAYFPFGGPPYHPFLAWAKRTGRVWSSPVGLLVHDTAGLFVSFRGAILIPETLAFSTSNSPCTGCSKPCLGACPVGALDAGAYDVPACKGYLSSPAGARCMSNGCAVRRACPVGQHKRTADQSAFHMKAFLHP